MTSRISTPRGTGLAGPWCQEREPNENSENVRSDPGPRKALTTTAIIQMTKPRPRDLPRVWRENKKGDECLAIPWGVRFRQDDIPPRPPPSTGNSCKCTSREVWWESWEDLP